MPNDFLSEIVSARTRRNPSFPRLVAEAESRRKAARALAAQREKSGFSQTIVAARMGTSASVVSKLEGGADVRMSTFMRYCAAIGATRTPSLTLVASTSPKKVVSRASHR